MENPPYQAPNAAAGIIKLVVHVPAERHRRLDCRLVAGAAKPPRPLPHPKTEGSATAQNLALNSTAKEPYMDRHIPRCPSITFALILSGGLTGLLISGAQAQPLSLTPANDPARSVTLPDTRSAIPPALSVPTADSPVLLLATARRAATVGRTEEAHEALDRAETRSLDRSVAPTAASAPDQQHAILAVDTARHALATHDRDAALAAIEDALATVNRPSQRIAMTRPSLTVPASRGATPPESVITRALLPGYWALSGARYVWVPAETTLRTVEITQLVPDGYAWRDGSYLWIPTHHAN